MEATYTGPAYEGSTACVVVIRGNQMIVGHVGDSRCVLSRQGGLAIDLSFDHKPCTRTESERERVQNAGGRSLGLRCEQVMGNYVVKEQWVLGDFGGGDFAFKKNKDLDREKQMLVCDPDILADDITDDMEFLVIASQGLCDTSDEGVDDAATARPTVMGYDADSSTGSADATVDSDEVDPNASATADSYNPRGHAEIVASHTDDEVYTSGSARVESGELAVPTPSANNTVADEVKVDAAVVAGGSTTAMAADEATVATIPENPRLPNSDENDMDAGGEEAKQERHLVLAHELFLLSRPDLDDLANVALRSDALDAVKSDGMAPLFESLATAGVLLKPDDAAARRDARADRRGGPQARRELMEMDDVIVGFMACETVSQHPEASEALIEGNRDISTGLELIHIWALHVAEADPDTE
uniref:protein-serine/threonine phosphatase n=1 Tax=Oryza rufipogon TaxID=4529 RepID=A0A0E0NHC8_ORYRU